MTVYIALHTWDTPDNEGSEILGVYSNFEKAREQIEVEADATSISEFHLRGNANVRNGGARVGGKITDRRGICLSFGIYEISCLWKI